MKGICHVPLCLLCGSMAVWEGGRGGGAPMWPWDREREQGWESLPNPPLPSSPPPLLQPWSTEAWCEASSSSSSSSSSSFTKLIPRCEHSSWETPTVTTTTRKEAMFVITELREIYIYTKKGDRAYLCGCMAAWHTVMSTLIKHGGHSQPSQPRGRLRSAGKRRSRPRRCKPPSDWSPSSQAGCKAAPDWPKRFLEWLSLFGAGRGRDKRGSEKWAAESTWFTRVPLHSIALKASPRRVSRWVSFLCSRGVSVGRQTSRTPGLLCTSLHVFSLMWTRPLFKLLPPSWLFPEERGKNTALNYYQWTNLQQK